MKKNRRKTIEFEEGSGNVFADLSLTDADELYARAQIGFGVYKILKQVTVRSFIQAYLTSYGMVRFGRIRKRVDQSHGVTVIVAETGKKLPV